MSSDFDAVISDIETDGLEDSATVIHCASITSLKTGATIPYRPHEIDAYLEQLSKAKVIINHNYIGFDGPVIERLHGFPLVIDNIFDTLVVGRALWPDRPQGHSLKSWGEFLGVLKGDFGETADWSVFSEEMMTYNMRDNRVTRHLCIYLLKKLGWDYAKFMEYMNGKGHILLHLS